MPKSGNLRVLFVTTWAFTACFAVWTMFGVTGIPIRAQLNLDSTQVGLLTATPVLTGAQFRLPFGMWTDRFGGRVIMLFLLVGCAIPLWISSYASALWQFLLLRRAAA
jgi:NNP family nitrate/nitrite transporter-like MFS transporter